MVKRWWKNDPGQRVREDHLESSSSVSTSAALVGALALTTGSAFCVHALVSKYGWEGLWWYLWEGSPHHPRIRDRMEVLEAAKVAVEIKVRDVRMAEEALDQAKVRDCTHINAAIVGLWEALLPGIDLRFFLAQISSDLDKIAGRVDAVSSDGEEGIKDIKKRLSNELVLVMERIDVLVSFFSTSLNVHAEHFVTPATFKSE